VGGQTAGGNMDIENIAKTYKAALVEAKNAGFSKNDAKSYAKAEVEKNYGKVMSKIDVDIPYHERQRLYGQFGHAVNNVYRVAKAENNGHNAKQEQMFDIAQNVNPADAIADIKRRAEEEVQRLQDKIAKIAADATAKIEKIAKPKKSTGPFYLYVNPNQASQRMVFIRNHSRDNRYMFAVPACLSDKEIEYIIGKMNERIAPLIIHDEAQE
jgi:ribosome recycling factor